MQRINLFPNPVFAGPLTGISHWGGANGTVRDNAVHITGANGGYGFNVAVPFNVPLVLSMRVNASEDNVAGMMIIQTTDKPEINNMLGSQRFKRGISDVLHRFTVTSHGFRFEVNPNGIRDVAVSNVLIERADTYDIAVGGGASGLLHRGYDATRLRRSVGRVMSDDNHEHLPGNKGENTGRTALVSEVRGRTRRQLLHSLHSGKCWANAINWQAIRNLQPVHFAGNCRERTCARCRHLACQLWRFGHHCDRHHDLRELQCHEKDIRRAGNNRIQRGYHATRLTLTGVMA